MSPTSQSGFSLPLVLLVIGALAAVAVLANLTARGNARGAAAATALAQADALAETGVALALLELDRQRPARVKQAAASVPSPWRLDCRLDPGTLHLTTQDEGGKIDLNYADARLLTALFVGLGVARARAQALADAIIDYRDTDDDRRPFGAERDDYIEAGRTAGPKNARFTDVAEVHAVLGMTQDLARRITPYVTVHSARDGIDPTVADKTLVTLLARGDAETGFTAPDDGEAPTRVAQDTPLPAPFAAASLRRYFKVTADAQLPNARFIREAIVDSAAPPAAAAGSRQVSSRYRLWSWRRHDGLPAVSDDAKQPNAGSLPPC
jgi:type II secretory pathway component PulK